MAGNKKNKRKPVPKGIGTAGRMVERMETGLVERKKRRIAQRERNLRLAHLPIGHPANAYVLDWTFAPFDQLFAEQERTGSNLFDECGNAVMWVEREHVHTSVVDACFGITDQFAFAAGELGWGEVPPGMMAYALKLARAEPCTLQDIADARATVDWMRAKLATITCFDWTAAMHKMEQRQECA
jgi:hypothetical protein